MDQAARTRAQAKLELPPERCFSSLAEALAAVECDAVLVTTFLFAQDERQHGTCVSFFALCERKKRNTKEDKVPPRMITPEPPRKSSSI